MHYNNGITNGFQTMTTPTVSTFELARDLIERGIYIGPRDPRRNKAFNGVFMICEDANEGPSEDAGRGGYCIVGDNLTEMVQEAAAWYDIG